jgi:molybdopterin-guanine dinucleotide biosynthesis protein A
MGGVAKGLLTHEGQSLVERLVARCRSVAPDVPIFLVGDAAAYGAFGLQTIADQPRGIGPLGGLHALLDSAAQSGDDAAIALACDLPYVTRDWLRRLFEESPEALALAPYADERWYPLCARYGVGALSAVRATLNESRHSLQRVFAQLGDGAHAMALSETELAQLSDWDTPEDRIKPRT